MLRVDQDSVVKWELQVRLETLEQKGTQETWDQQALLEDQGPLVIQGWLVAPGWLVTVEHLGFWVHGEPPEVSAQPDHPVRLVLEETLVSLDYQVLEAALDQ